MTDIPGLAAINSYLPETVEENSALTERLGFTQTFIDEKLGIERRHIAAPGETVADMAVAAGERLLDATGQSRDGIGLLIVVTQNPDYRLPTTANLVQHRLGLPTTCAAFDINQGCSGYVYGLSVATALMAANGIKAGLLITSEAYSKVRDPDDRGTVPLFGDAAAASLLLPGGRGRPGAFTFGSDGSGAEELIVRGGGCRNPAMPIEGEGALRMNGRSIYNFMMRRMPADIDACLRANALTHDQIDLFLVHQASRFMIQSLARALGQAEEKVPVRMGQVGNTVSCTLPLLIEDLGGVDALSGKTALLSGFGVGLSWASTVMRFA